MNIFEHNSIDQLMIRKSKLLEDAANDKIPNWNADDIKNRCILQMSPDGREIFCLDNIPLLEFYPIEIITEHQESNVMMRVTQKYRKFY